jgi:hypothetical protein
VEGGKSGGGGVSRSERGGTVSSFLLANNLANRCILG